MSSEPKKTEAATAIGLCPGVDGPPQVLRVRNRGQDRSVPLSELDGVIECPPISSVPAAPVWLLGVAAYKGALISVVDLAAACGDPGLAAREPGDRLLLVESGAQRIAFSVDAILSPDADAPPSDRAPIALRALAAEILGAVPAGKGSERVEPTTQ